MDGDRGLSLLADPDQWARCRHEHTALLAGGGVQLTWDEDPAGTPGPAAPGPHGRPAGPAGLAFDRWCRAYRSHPREGRVSVHLRGRAVEEGGDAACGGALACPLGVGVDADQRLYVVESGSGRVSVADLWSRRLLRRVPVRSAQHRARRPVDLATHCCRAYVLVRRPTGIVVVSGRRGPLAGPRLRRPRCRGALEPSRLAAAPDGALLVLWRRDDGVALVATVDGVVLLEVPGGTDLDRGPDGLLVVAREPDRPFRRFRPDGPGGRSGGSSGGSGWLELEPVAAPGYDGGAAAVAPDGRVAYTTATGIGWATGPAARRRGAGRVVTYRLDGGAYRMRWGRVFLDACIPQGTDVRLRFVGSDDDEVVDPIEWQPAERGTATVRHPELTPSLPSREALEAASSGPGQPLFRRPTGRERPWAQIAADDRFETYEAPVAGARGRYLWVALDLTGTAAVTPRVRAVRVERPGHRLLSQLPRSWSRDEEAADFLHRLLAPAEGMVHELDERAAQRALLVDPATTPQEALGWLASFAGLVLDRRWSEGARRTLVAEAYRLFRRRGTLATLRRLLEIYLGYEPAIVEQWQLRGVPGGVLGATASTRATRAAPVVGGGMRAGGTRPDEDGYTTSAHRFSVLIPADLSSEQLEVVRSVLDTHRPAHTRYEICELGFGMRVGRHLHVRLTSVVGPEVGFGPAMIGQVAIGGDGVVGVPELGARLGDSSVAGAVRVG